MKITKDTDDYLAEFYITYPKFVWRRKATTFRKLSEETTEIDINLFRFQLTTNKNYVILEVSCIFGIGIKIIEKG